MESSKTRKVLILYQFSNHDQLINSLCENLNEQDNVVDAFNVVTWKFLTFNNYKNPFLLRFFTPLMSIPKIRGIILKFFRNIIIKKLSRKYQIIDIHFYSTIYDELIKYFLENGNKVKITIWGSDFYKANDERRKIQREFYRRVDIIHIGTPQMKKDFLQEYPECEDKIRLARFGIRQFDIIDELMLKGNVSIYKKELNLPDDKIIISCGANGSEVHQHALIFESLQKMPIELKNKVFLVVPMTYGGSPKYLKETKKILMKLGLPFKQFVNSLSIDEICKLRIVCDIAITIQKTDAFSAAVQEHIYAGGILIAGEWLPYNILKDSGIYYKSTSLNDLTETIGNSIIHIQNEKQECIKNKAKIEKLSSWKSVINDWKEIYEELVS